MHAGADTAPPPSSPATPTVEAGAGEARAGALLRATRWTRLGLHLLQGVLTIAAVYPFTGRDTHQALRRRWSLRLLRVLGMRLEHRGEAVAPGCMLVANHVSWVDIFAINALAPSAFVSKAEVRAWPVIGWLAAKNDTIFLRRGSRGHARIINEETAALLDAGCNVAIFPEGTTTDGRRLLNFHAALLQPAIESGRPIQPVSLAYLTADGSHCHAAAYVGEMTLLDSLRAILATPSMTVRLRPLRALDARQASRRELAQAAQAAIALSLGCPPPHTAPGTPPDPQA